MHRALTKITTRDELFTIGKVIIRQFSNEEWSFDDVMDTFTIGHYIYYDGHTKFTQSILCWFVAMLWFQVSWEISKF